MSAYAVTASVLNVRTGPGLGHAILDRLVRGDVVKGIDASADGRWRRIAIRRRDGLLEGWASSKYLKATETKSTSPAVPANEPAWLTLARGEIGVKEYPGGKHNKRILEYAKTTTLAADSDEVPWCSSFVNWCMQGAKQKGTRSAAARSWLDWGISLPKPVPGCVTVFSRGSNPQSGHVAFFLGDRGAMLDVLGGNQSNQVKVSPYPAATRLDYRWPKGVEVPR